MESQKEGAPDAGLAKHHMGRRVFMIWNPRRGVFRTLGLPNTIWGRECLLYGVPKGWFSGRVFRTLGVPNTIRGGECLLYGIPKGGVGRTVGWPNTIWGGECLLYGAPKRGNSGRLICQPPYGEERVCDVESQKEGFPDGRFAKHHMGKRMFIIWNPKRGVFRRLGLPTTIWGGECV